MKPIDQINLFWPLMLACLLVFGNCSNISQEESAAFFERAMLAYAQRNYAGATIPLEKILEANDKDLRALLLLQKSYYYQQKYKAAAGLGESVLNSEPNNISALTFTALSYLHLEQVESHALAEQYIELALQYDPDNIDAWSARGFLHEKQGNNSQAIASYSAAIHKGSSLGRAHLRLGNLYQTFEMHKKSRLHLHMAHLIGSGSKLKSTDRILQADMFIQKPEENNQ